MGAGGLVRTPGLGLFSFSLSKNKIGLKLATFSYSHF